MNLFRVTTIVFLAMVIIVSCTTQQEQSPEEKLQKIKTLIQDMELEGQAMSNRLDSVAHFYQDLLAKKDSLLKNPVPNPYNFEGPFSTNLPGQDSSLSSIIILNTTPDRQKAMLEVQITNSLDSVFRDFIRKNPIAVQIYSNSSNQVSRVYPSYDAKNIVDPNIDVKEFNFYYEADLAHNPGKGVVWIPDAYIDPAGKGWILSLVHPVYDGQNLFAVVGVDFTVSDIIQNYLESMEGEFILVNEKGDIVAGKADAIEAFSMPPLKNHVYRETVQSDNFRISDFNIFNSKSREVRKMAQSFLMDKKNHFDFIEEPNLNEAVCMQFSQIGWFLIEVFPNI